MTWEGAFRGEPDGPALVWVFWIGLAFALVGFVRLAPTARSIETDQQRLGADGQNRRLLPALVEPNRD